MNRLRQAEVRLGVVLSLAVVSLDARFALSAGALWRDEVSTFNLTTPPSYQARSPRPDATLDSASLLPSGDL